MPELSTRELIQHGEALFEQGAYLDALDAFERVLGEDPENVHALNDAGLTCGELDQTRAAVDYFERALALQPDFEAAFIGLLDVLLDAGEVEATVHAFLRYEEAIPNTPEKQRYADALTALTAPEQPHADAIQRAEELLMQDEPEQALAILNEVLEQDPGNANALNDAGHAYVDLGQAVEASRCFEQALETDPTHQSAFYSLLDLLVRAETPELAVEVFLQYHEQIPDDEEKAKYAEALGSWAEQQTANTASGDSLPGEAQISAGAPAEPDSPEGLRIAIVCGPDRKFITTVGKELARQGHAVQTCFFDGQIELQRIQRAMEWADVTWFEWCDQILVHASQKLRKTSGVICRLHSYEALCDLPQHVDWSFVDTVVTESEHMHDIIRERFPRKMAEVPVHVVRNGIDLDVFPFEERRAGFNIAYVGYINHKKNPALLLQCMHALVQHDDRYHLHVAGVHQEPRYEIYWNHMVAQLGLTDHVTMHGWVEDVALWLRDKQYVTLSSVHEGSPYSILEGAARGLKPLIHCFRGTDRLYPDEWTYRTPDEFVERIVDAPYDSSSYRAFIEERHTLHAQVQHLTELLREAATSRDGIFAPGTLRAMVQRVAGSIKGEADAPVAGGALPTVVVPVYDRLPYLRLLAEEGFLDGAPILVTCDGSSDAFVEAVAALQDDRPHLRHHRYLPNRGLAAARREGARHVETSHIICCDDDDFYGDLGAFAAEAADLFARHDDVLMVIKPTMYTYYEDGRTEEGYGFDSTAFDGLTGLELLERLVELGEPHGLNNGACYNREMYLSVATPEFDLPEDYGTIIRLCMRYPNHRVYVASSGTYFRLRSATAMTHHSTLEQHLETMMFMCEGLLYLRQQGRLTPEGLIRRLLQRGELIQRIRGYGRVAAQTVATLLKGRAAMIPANPEANQTIAFLARHRSALPEAIQQHLSAEADQALASSMQYNAKATPDPFRVEGHVREGGLLEVRAPQVQTGIVLRPQTKDVNVYYQVFHWSEYEFDLGQPRIIVDAGAHIGLASLLFANRHPDAQILAIEPEAANFRMLQRNTAMYDRIHAVQAGLWSHATTLAVSDPNEDTWSFQFTEGARGADIPALTISDVIQMLDVDHIDVLKMDIEGAEVEVMNHSTDWIDKVRMLIIETHDRFRPGCTEALERAVAGRGFRRTKVGENVILTKDASSAVAL